MIADEIVQQICEAVALLFSNDSSYEFCLDGLAVGSSHFPAFSFNIHWNLSIEDTIGTQLAVLYTVELLYRGHHWDPAGCPVYSVTSL